MTDDLIRTPVTPDLLRGCVETEQTSEGLLPHRLPAWVRRQIPEPQLLMVESQPSGVRLVFRTTATRIELDTVPTKRAYVGNPPMPDGVYDLVVDGRLVDQRSVDGGKLRTVDMTTGAAQITHTPAGTLRFATLTEGLKDVEIWLPYDETTELVALRTDAPVEPAAPSDRRTWVHHGSSISHGSVAASPSQTWPARAAALAGVELVNLGFGGSALLDPAVARVLRDTPADVISLKIGINLVNTDLMRLRAFGPAVHGFLDTIREGHPTTPLLVISPVLCPIQEETPGPLLPDLSGDRIAFLAAGDPEEVASGKLTLRVIRSELARIVIERRSDDPHLHLLDGRELYREDDEARLPLPDRVHPDAETHRLMGDRFAEAAFSREGAPLAPNPHRELD